MDYLTRVLGIRVNYYDKAKISLPNFIHSRYRVQKATLDGKEVLFVFAKGELESVNAVKKHLARIEQAGNAQAVLVPKTLTYRQKEYLLRDRIPFIVEGKQIYLPFMAVYLQERCDGEKKELAGMLPSAQLLLLYYIYHGCGEMLTSVAVQDLGFTSTSISRASRQLEELGLIQTVRRGVQKVLITDKTPEELFNAAKANMNNPVKRTIYVSKSEIGEDLLLSGYSALSEYTMINPANVICVAADSIAVWERVSSSKLQNSDDQYAVELWRYNPRKLANGHCVDRLSLALSLSSERDERVEEAVEEMLKTVWEDIDGKRD